MTVSSTTRRAGPFTGNSVTTVFPFSFKVFAKTDVKLLLIDPNGNSTELTLDSQFSVALNTDQNNSPGGTITYPITGTPLVATYQLVVLGDIPLDQTTDITNSGGFYPDVVEAMIDRATIQIQQVEELAGRAIVVTEAENTAPVLPPAKQRAGMLLGFDIAGNVELLAPTASVGAGDLRNEIWIDGTDYISGTSTSVTLSRPYGTKANLGSVVMQGISQDPSSYSLTGLTLTFNAVIPLGVAKIWCTGGTTLSVPLVSPVGVTVEQFGAKGDGSADDTHAIQLALSASPCVEFAGPGPYICGPLTIPSTTKSLTSRCGSVIKPSGSVPVGAGFSTWITASALVDAEMSGLKFQAPSATYGGLTVLLASACTNTKFRNLTLNGAGYTGISLALGTNNKVLNCSVADYKGNGIQVSGSSLAVLDTGTEVAGCYTEGNGVASIAHGVSFIYAVDFNCHNNRSKNAGTFGFEAALCEGGTFADNISYNSIHEGLNVEDSNHIKTIGNTARWDAGGGPGIDFGMSFFGNTRNCIGLEVIGNKVVNSPSSGIAFAGSVSFGVQHSPVRDNLVFNCNAKRAAVAGGVDNLAGIMLSASLTQANPIAGNTVVDVNGYLTYAIAELNFGTGSPSSNEITSNRTFSSGYVGGGVAIHTAGVSTKTALNTSQL
jgi:hypothetical protein